MSSALRISLLGLASMGALLGCAPPAPTTSGVARSPQVAAAWFTERPAGLVEAAKAACTEPGEEFVQPRPGTVQCRMLLSPETTAAVILHYDGDIEALPQLVVSLTTTQAQSGYLVTGCAFLKVPRKDGTISRIVQNDREVATKLGGMLAAVGGKPLRNAPPEAVERCFAL